MSKIEFTSHQKQAMATALQNYMEQELDVEIGQFDADFMLDFITAKFGPAFYNQGIKDAQAIMERKMMDISDELYEIEQISDYQ
tara:strand:+ start:2002 stop:2253 length:252 start_codon:yes stop_codon:yes gene_type:complete